MDYKYLSYTGLKRFYAKIQQKLDQKLDKINGDISETKVRGLDTITTEFPDPIAGESTKTFLGKIKKCLADWKAIKSTLVTLSMLTSQYENSTSKVPTAALVYALKQSLDTTNSNLLKVYYGRVQITTTANTSSPLGYNGTLEIFGQPWYPDNVIALIPISAYLPADYGVQALVGEYSNKRLVISSKVAGTFDVNFAIIYK